MPKKYTPSAYTRTLEARIRRLVLDNPSLLKVSRSDDLINIVRRMYGENISAENIFKTAGILRTERKYKIIK